MLYKAINAITIYEYMDKLLNEHTMFGVLGTLYRICVHRVPKDDEDFSETTIIAECLLITCNQLCIFILYEICSVTSLHLNTHQPPQFSSSSSICRHSSCLFDVLGPMLLQNRHHSPTQKPPDTLFAKEQVKEKETKIKKGVLCE